MTVVDFALMPRAKRKSAPRNPQGRAGAPVSLYPLSFDEAVTGLAQVKPPEKPQAKPKRKSSER